jgi:peptide-methionine (S)-S-oxide reductase
MNPLDKGRWPLARWGIALLALFAAVGAALALMPDIKSSGSKEASLITTVASSPTEKALFAGGCFWCVESDFDKVPGVLRTTSGYTGGQVANPSYEQVSGHGTGHAEAVEVEYDPRRVSYAQLLAYFWRTIDPTTVDRQFCDAGSPYRTAIFPLNAEQMRLALASRAQVEKTKPFAAPIVTEVTSATVFYPAEDYHQDYYIKNPVRYKYYRTSCGRDQRLKQLWGK